MIYIACPEKYATGGTELLHQLFFKLTKMTKDVAIYYYNYSDTGSPVNTRFEKYEVNYVTNIEDVSTNLLIVPEVSVSLLNKYKNIQKCIWWLSVDNYYKVLGRTSNWFKSKLKELLFKINGKYKENMVNFSDTSLIHLVQSKYAFDFLEKRGVQKVKYLSDYIGSDFFNSRVDYSSRNRQNRVLYNPRKGIEFTQKLINSSDEIEFVPLINLSQIEIIELCKTSKVYIDFGNHPGKDRFPREAAQMGCIVITGLRGSAKFDEDVRIPSKYKFKDNSSNIINIIDKIKEVLINYDNLIEDLKEYRMMIMNEEVKFEKDVQELWENHFKMFTGSKE